MTTKFHWAGSVFILSLVMAGCNHQASQEPAERSLGDQVKVGDLTYVVVESNWYSQLGDGFKIRSPQQRFMEVTLSILNGGGSDVSVPLLTVESSAGKTYTELDDGEGVDSWLGVFRTIKPGVTQRGRVLFDVPLGSYRMKLSDGAGPGVEKFAWVNIPLHIDVDSNNPTPNVPVTR